MNVAAGTESLPGGSGQKGLFPVSAGTHRPGWGESLAGGGNAGAVVPGNPASASAAWQSVLSSLGVGATEGDDQEPANGESLNGELGQGRLAQESATGNVGANALGFGSVGSRRQSQSAPVAGSVKLRAELAAPVQTQQRSSTGIMAEKVSAQKPAATDGSGGVGKTRDAGASDSATPRRISSPELGEVAAPLPQMTPVEVAVIPGHAIQQNLAAAMPHLETVDQEKSAFETALPESDQVAQPAVLPGLMDSTTAGMHSEQRAQNGNIRAREVSAGVAASQPLGTNTRESGPIGGSPIAIAETHQYAVSPQSGADVESNAVTISGATSEVATEAGVMPAASVLADGVQAAQGTVSAMPIVNKSPEAKSNAIAKSSELNVTLRNPVQSAVPQSASPTSTAEDPGNVERASGVVDDGVRRAHTRGTAGKSEASGRVNQAQSIAGSPSANTVLPPEAIANAAVPPPASSTGTTGHAAGSHGGSGTGEAFTTLDADGSNRVTWVHAGAQRAEAGFEDPRLGWVSVRADVSGGAIHASLVPASTDAAQVMGGHLDGLNAYLSEHHSTVETLTLASPSGRGQEQGESGSQGQGMQQGAGQESSQESNRENGQAAGGGLAASGQSNANSANADGGKVWPSAGSDRTRDREQETLTSASGGRISVMA